jgi:hypothetical protein
MDAFDFWAGKVKAVPDVLIRKWIEDRFPGLEEFFFTDECNKLGMYSWVYQTMCCHLSLDAPTDWFIWEVWMFHEALGKGL